MASDYQGETIQVFVFFQGKFLGYQCFGQDRLTIGGAPGMDLPLPDCPEDEGYWDVYVSRGALYVWFRGPAGGEQGERPGDPRKVQPLDSFSLGEYRLQVKLMEGQGLVQPSIEAEEDLPGEDLPADRGAFSPEEASEPDERPASRAEEGQEASPSVRPGEEEEAEQEPGPEPPNEVEGISIDYARSIWREEEEDLSRDDEGQTVAGEDRKEGSLEEPSLEAGEDTEPELAPAMSPDYVKDIWGLSEEQETGQQEEQASEAEIHGPAASDEGSPRADMANEWIGFGLEEEDPSEESLHAEQAEEEPQRDEPQAEPSPEDISEEEASWEEHEEEEEEEEDDKNISYFSLVKEVFPNRAQESKTPCGDRRALEVVRFRGRDIQDIGYLEGSKSYTIRKGWNRSVWKRRGGVPPNFKLVRMKNGGAAELHIRESVNGRIYSDAGSQDVWDLRGGKRGRFGLKGRASWLPLPADTWAVLRVNSGRYLVRYVSPRPKPDIQPLRPNVSMGQFKLVSLSMLSHLLLILVIGLAVPDRTLEGYSRMDRFARIDPNALKALKPPPPPKELKKPKPVAKQKMKKPKPPAASKQRVPKSAQRSPVPTKGKASAGAAKKEVDVAQTGLLAALGGPDAGVLDAKGNSAILLAAVTNLDAVAVPSDTTTFNLAGVAGKLATSEIQVPTSDVIETVGAAQLIKNGDGTLGAMASKGTGEVRAIVHEPPKAKISIRGGMSREAVLKVVNAHLDEVRDCYERELLHNPGISGKILMEWLIQLDGSVRYAKVKFTNIGHSSDLHACIQAQVVTWNFPRPKGGEEVMVTFPFLFESMGF